MDLIRDPTFLSSLSPTQGGFRGRVFEVLDRFVRERSADSGRWVSIDESGSDLTEFDRLWTLQLFHRASDQLRDNDPLLAEVFSLYYDAGADEQDVADRMKTTVFDVQHRLQRARALVRNRVRRSIEDYVASDVEYQAEVAALRMTL